MKKIKLDISGLSYSQTQSGAYALVLSEAGGKRRLPIIIGGFEAQAIAICVPEKPWQHSARAPCSSWRLRKELLSRTF